MDSDLTCLRSCDHTSIWVKTVFFPIGMSLKTMLKESCYYLNYSLKLLISNLNYPFETLKTFSWLGLLVQDTHCVLSTGQSSFNNLKFVSEFLFAMGSVIGDNGAAGNAHELNLSFVEIFVFRTLVFCVFLSYFIYFFFVVFILFGYWVWL